eukprot:Opistho-2@19572
MFLRQEKLKELVAGKSAAVISALEPEQIEHPAHKGERVRWAPGYKSRGLESPEETPLQGSRPFWTPRYRADPDRDHTFRIGHAASTPFQRHSHVAGVRSRQYQAVRMSCRGLDADAVARDVEVDQRIDFELTAVAAASAASISL